MDDSWEMLACLTRMEETLEKMEKRQEEFAAALLKKLTDVVSELGNIASHCEIAWHTLQQVETSISSLDRHFTGIDDD